MLRSVLTLRRFFSSKLFTKDHEWLQLFPETKTARVGITHYAQDQLGEIIHVEFPALGKAVSAEDSVLVIESVKVAADVYAPVTGEVIKTNPQVEKTPTLINEDPLNAWLFEIKYEKEPANLLSQEEYQKHIS